jgi:hypothetical protein
MEPARYEVGDIQQQGAPAPPKIWLEIEVFEKREGVAAYYSDKEFDANYTSRENFGKYFKKFRGKKTPLAKIKKQEDVKPGANYKKLDGELEAKTEGGVKFFQAPFKSDYEGKTIMMQAKRKNVACGFSQPKYSFVGSRQYLHQEVELVEIDPGKTEERFWWVYLGYSDHLWPTEEQLVQIKTYEEKKKDQFEKEKKKIRPVINRVLILRDGSNVKSVCVDGIPHIEVEEEVEEVEVEEVEVEGVEKIEEITHI